MKRTSPEFWLPIVLSLLVSGTAQAYVGPGAGVTAIGAVLSLVGAVLLALVGFIWYPVRRLLRGRAKRANLAPGTPATESLSPPKAE
jgi:hypothetical protein